MSDLLKEAIADAKAVRETALQNAKMALEEAFTPQLKSMLSAKLKEDEMEDEDVPMEDEMGDEEEEVPAEEGYYEDEEMGDDEEPAMEDEMGDEEVPMEDEMGDEDEVEEENLDLEAIIRELETELKEEDDAYDEKASPKKDGLAEEDDAYDEKASPKKDGLAEEDDAYDEKASPKKDGLAEAEDDDDDEVEVDESVFTEDEDEDDDKEEVEEQSDSSKIGSGDNKVDYADAGDEEDPGKGSVHEQLKEYKEAVVFLKDKLHEVNILNAKLLFTNKLFKSYSLNNNQKLKVVETFDRAQTTREIKLVYSTLAEQFGDNGSIARKKSINESASKPVASTKPSKESRKVITEESQVANRFKKLAGIIK
tara:strand:- start:857 stop:1954 length:1098 start_codon:yes stop_codon:yes gene_type:complete